MSEERLEVENPFFGISMRISDYGEELSKDEYVSKYGVEPVCDSKHVDDTTANKIREYGKKIKNVKEPSVTVIQGDNKVDIDFPFGVVVINGASNSGKSLISKYLEESLGAKIIAFHEPIPESLSSPASLIRMLHEFMLSEERCLIVDSFRYFAYNSNARSAAMAGGITTSLFTDLTDLSIFLMNLKKTLFIVMNFISSDGSDDKKREVIWNSLVGATSGVIQTTSKLDDIDLSKEEDAHRLISFDYMARTSNNGRTRRNYSLAKLPDDAGIGIQKSKRRITDSSKKGISNIKKESITHQDRESDDLLCKIGLDVKRLREELKLNG